MNPSLRLNHFHWIAVFLLFTTVAKAQNGSITGRVKGQGDMETPIVNLLNAKDSGIVKATMTDTAGNFVFERLNFGSYLISVQEMRYKPIISSLIKLGIQDTLANIADIELEELNNQMKEVVISAAKPFVQRQIDRVVVNPDALISNSGTTALEVLEKAPGVMVDVNGNISMKGKSGVVVFIDDKPTYLSASDLANYLRSLPSGSIASIELMSNPPAKYDAAGNGGVINIRLKKNIQQGVNGGINLSYGQGRYARSNNSFNLNYRINKINFFTNIGFSQNNSYQDLTINRYYYKEDGSYNSGFTQNSYMKRSMGSYNARAGVDYYLSKKSTLGAVLAGFYNPQNVHVSNQASITDVNSTPTTLISSISPSEQKWTNGSINLNYTLKIDEKGKELSANADYIQYNSKQLQSLENRTFQPDGTLTSNTLLTSSLPADIGIQSFKLDYTHPIEGKGRVDGGAKFSNVSTDNNALFFDEVNGSKLPNYEFSNHFKYKEQISAAYLNYSNDWKRLSLQLGVRLEHTNANGHQFGNPTQKDSSFTFQYTNLFPTLFLLYKLDSLQKHQLSFAAGRRIDRPNYQSLNPFTYPIDRYTLYGGNPFLQPTFTYSFELAHTFKNFLTTSFEYSIARNLINETNEQRGTIYYSRPGNFGSQRIYGFTVNGNIPIKKWWSLQLYSELKNVAVNSVIYGQTIDEQKWYWYIGPMFQFKINEKMSAELGGSYQTRILSGQFLTIPVGQLRAGISYKVLKNTGTIRFNVNDLFYTNQPGGDIRNIANSRANWLSYLDTRVATLSFAYRFNKGKVMQARNSGASDTERSRVNAR